MVDQSRCWNGLEAPRISIVTPSYNQAQFVGETIESVLSQEGDFEIDYLVMDCTGGGDNESRAPAPLVGCHGGGRQGC